MAVRFESQQSELLFSENAKMTAAWKAALLMSGRPFRFSRLCLVGEGRAGKTALANALCNRPFAPTPSTIGVGTYSMEITCTNVEASTVDWRVLSPDSFVHLTQQQLNWEAAQRLIGSVGSDNGSVLDNYKGEQVTLQPPNRSSVSLPGFSAVSEILPNTRSHGNQVPLEPVADDEDNQPRAFLDDEGPVSVSARTCVARSSTCAPVATMDQELILQLQGQTEPLRMSLLDFGGQDAFYSLHHLYVTRESFYLVVFNMKCMVGADATEETIKQCKSYLKFWLYSIYHHARAQSAELNGSVAPIILVGTHKDEICSRKEHEEISKMLWDEFHSSPVWTSVISLQEGVGSTGCGSLSFYPIDNRRKQSPQDPVDDVVIQIQTCIQKHLEKEVYLKRKVPLPWLQVFDELVAAKEGRAFVALTTVQEIAGKYGFPSSRDITLETEVIFMLKYFHGLGLLMHHDHPKLRNIVVLDTVRCLVNPASIIMCQHDIHQLPVHLEAKACKKDYYDELVLKGRVHRSLLPILWRDSLEIVDEVCELMVHYGLMLPILEDNARGDACFFLVPSLLPKQPPAPASVAAVRSHFYFAFGSQHKVGVWQDDNFIPVADIAAQGFFPNGLFSRFIGKIVSRCQRSYSYFKSRCSRHETTTFFGRHQFTIRELKELNLIQVLVLVSNPRMLLMELSNLLQETVLEMIPYLSFFAAVLCDGGTNSNFEPSCIADAHLAVLSGDKGLIERCNNNLDFDIGDGPQSAVELRKKFSLWLPPSGLLPSGYHVFLSYRWTGIDRQHWGFDEDLSMGIFQKLSMDLGPDKEEVTVFCDKQRLQPARDFQSDFTDALLSSKLPVVLMSSAALLKFVPLKADSYVDNLLLEWTIIADLKASGIIKNCLVVFFGAHNKLAGRCAEVLGDIFTQKMPEVLAAVASDRNYESARKALASVVDLDSKDIFSVLPDVAVKRVNDKTRCILLAHGLPVSPDIDSRSVREVVNSLKSYMLGVEAWEEAKKMNSSHANEEVLRAVIKHCSDLACRILERDRPLSAKATHEALCPTMLPAHVSTVAPANASPRLPPCSFETISRAEVSFIPHFRERRGGFGVVRQAMYNGNLVAVKVPLISGPLGARDRKKFMEELEMTYRLRHAKCVTMFGAVTDDEGIMLLMEWMEGGSLYSALDNHNENPVLPRLRLSIARQVADGLQYLHAKRIIHRDIKSLNVLLTSDFNEAKLCDFGLAKLRSLTSASISVASGHVVGTFAYAAPEIHEGRDHSEASDVYSLGVVMWELMTCEVPFEGLNAIQIRARLQSRERPEIPNPLPTGFHSNYVALMSRCWHQVTLYLSGCIFHITSFAGSRPAADSWRSFCGAQKH
jgi:GTPase SAR1 family protein